MTLTPSMNDSTLALLAGAFVTRLRQETTPEQFAEIIRRNAAEPNEDVCHSHDFVDANMTMLMAWQATFGGAEFDMNSDDHIGVWNHAWQIAKRGWLGFRA